MTLYYLDTSALVKLYVREPGTEQALRLASRAGDNHFSGTSDSPGRDTLSLAAARACWRDCRHGRHSTARTISAASGGGLFLRQAITDATYDVACALADRHGLFALDAVQLAGYLALQTSFGVQQSDLRLRRSALIESSRSGTSAGVRSVLNKQLGKLNGPTTKKR